MSSPAGNNNEGEETDNFVKIMNSLEDFDKDFLHFRDDTVKVFQFPRRMILKRVCYSQMYDDIIKLMKSNKYPTMIISGQPGIGKTSFLYYLLHRLKIHDDYKHIDTGERVIKGIYVVKGKKNGNPLSNQVYELNQNTKQISKVNSNLNAVTDSIIIVDTFNGEYDKNNIVISISSPDEKNVEEYKGRDNITELYFETLSYDEVVKWFDTCIDIGRDEEFEKICEIYGNIPRQIYFHHLYKENYGNRDYWDYYVKLIDSVVGTIGYNNFVSNYMKQGRLTKEPLSNIILKYDYEEKMNNKLGHKVLVPKEHLKFISEQVEKYIVYKFYPPKDVTEYNKLCGYYNQIKKDIKKKRKDLIEKDIEMKRVAMKQKISYELSMEMIKLNTKEDKSFELNYEKPILVHHPDGGKHFVYFILDENNYFDLIMNGIFIKILLDGDELETDETKIKESIKEYNNSEKCKYKYCGLDENQGGKVREIIGRGSGRGGSGGRGSGGRGRGRGSGGRGSGKGGKVREIIGRKRRRVEEEEEGGGDDDEEEKEEDEVIGSGSGKGRKRRKREEDNEVMNENPPPLCELSGDDFKVFAYNRCYLRRKCYKSILKEVYPEDMDLNFRHQKSFLIYGQAGIGKSIFANFIKEFIHEKRNGVVRIKHIDKNGNRIGGYNESHKERDYILICDGTVIGEDDYGDAKMIILLADPSDKKYKTFQSKRCPLVMFIPPFTKEEVEKVIILEDPKYIIPNNHFINKSELREGSKAFPTDSSDYEEKIKLYRKNYKYYGGVIKNKECNEEMIKYVLTKMKENRKLKDIIKGINVSSLSKDENDNIKYSIILIYETLEDVTQSNHLIFVSETIRKIAKKILFKITSIEECKDTMNILFKSTNGGMKGCVYENIMLFLLKENKIFREMVINEMIKVCKFFEEMMIDKIYKDIKPKMTKVKIKRDLDKLNTNVKVVNVKDDADLTTKINKKEIDIFDLSYDGGFPDIDALIGPMGIQFTISNRHELSPEMVDILINLYKKYKGNRCNDFGLFFISSKKKVGINTKKDRDVSTFPLCLINLLDQSINVTNLMKLARNKAKTIYVSFEALLPYVYKASKVF